MSPIFKSVCKFASLNMPEIRTFIVNNFLPVIIQDQHLLVICHFILVKVARLHQLIINSVFSENNPENIHLNLGEKNKPQYKKLCIHKLCTLIGCLDYSIQQAIFIIPFMRFALQAVVR